MRVVTCDLTTCLLAAGLLLTTYCLLHDLLPRRERKCGCALPLVVGCGVLFGWRRCWFGLQDLDEAEAWALVSWLVG
jgi:hypothetical protein